MNKKLKTIKSVLMATCLTLTMSSTSLCAVVADAIEVTNAKTEAVIQEASEDLTTTEDQEKTSTDSTTTEDDTQTEKLYDISWYDSTKNKFEISNAKQLAGLAALANGKEGTPVTFSGKTILITNDIEVDESLISLFPIASFGPKVNVNLDIAFEGVFDGKNHTITMSAGIDDSNMKVGLFGHLESATIKNVTVDGSMASGGIAGGIAGDAIRSLIKNCTNKATIKSKVYLGGILGYGTYTIVEDCGNEGEIIAEDGCNYVGGIVGYLNDRGKVINSYNKGIINLDNGEDVMFVGGLVGYMYDSTLANSYNLSDINYEIPVSAGLVGYSFNKSIDNCYNLGEAKFGDPIIAAYTDTTVTNCYYLGGGKTEEDFKNGTIAELLNANVTSSNGYRLWTVDENKITTFVNYKVLFNTTPSDANVVLKNSAGETIDSLANGQYSGDSLTSGETYTYEVSADGYETTTGKFTYTEGSATINVKLTEKAIETVDVTFETENEDEKIVQSVEVGKALDFTPDSPTKEGYTFVGWYKDTDDTTTEYKNGQTYEENTTYKAKWAHVSMLGAQVKSIVDNKSGIRFGTKLYNDGDEVVEKGTIILPANLLKEGEALTLETSKVAKSVGKVNYQVNEEENYVVYLGTIVNMPSTQFDRQITASAYVIYKDKAGNNYTVYAPYQEGSTSVNTLLGE